MVMNIRRSVILIFIICIYLSFTRLDNTYFWDDEAQVGIIARNFLSTGNLSGWDGRNLFALRNGSLLDKELRIINPPLDYLVSAASFMAFGDSTWTGRFPFVVAGLIGLVIFAFLLRYDFGKDGLLWVYALGILAFSVVFLLNIRQCRHYALSLLFSQLIFYSYRFCLATKKFSWFMVLCVASLFFFYSHFLLCIAFLLALGIFHLLFYRYHFGVKERNKLIIVGSVFILATLPYALHYSIWVRPDMFTGGEAWYLHKFKLIWWNIRELNLLGCLPWIVFIGLIYFTIRYWKKESAARTTLQWVTFSFGYVFFLALLSRQPTNIETIADVRYLMPVIPFLAGSVGSFLWFVHKRMRIVALILFVLIISSNILTLTPYNWKFRWFLPAYIKEVHSDYPTSNKAVVDFLMRNAEQDDLVYAFPQYFNYPLVFYAGHKFRFCCLLNYQTLLPIEIIRNLHAPLFIEEHFPDWFIAFGKHRDTSELLKYFSREYYEDGRIVQFSYCLVKTLDVYWSDTSRSELPWHNFGPKIDFDKAIESVYIFRRSEL